jgi:dipeptidyl-peptidase-3
MLSIIIVMVFEYFSERVEDFRILRYNLSNFESLTTKQKLFLYYLQEASFYGRDIFYDQRFKYNLLIRNVLENIYSQYKENKKSKEYSNFSNYLKLFWISNGIHHVHNSVKLDFKLSKKEFKKLYDRTNFKFFKDLKQKTETFELIYFLLTDKKIYYKVTCKDSKLDVVKNSAVNYYDGVSQKEAETFYFNLIKKNKKLSWGLNSKLIKKNGKLVEQKYKLNGLYSKAINKIVENLILAKKYSENNLQKKSLDSLIDFFKSGDLKQFDKYTIDWLNNSDSKIDFILGFIENYLDPLAIKGAYESLVSMKNVLDSRRVNIIAKNAQWFENNSPTDKEFKKSKVEGIKGKAIDIVFAVGDSSPTMPIGVCLPNQTYIREQYGSKSVTLSNIILAYDEVSKNSGVLEEFYYSKETQNLLKKYLLLGNKLHTDFHEVIGHGSGKLKKGVEDYHRTLKNYANLIEETRADLFGLYFILDKKLIDLKLIPNLDVGKAFYNYYLTNGLLLQLARVKKNESLEQTHMQNRQLIFSWVYEKGKKAKIIEKKIKNKKTYFVINDYEKLRVLFGELLKEMQRIVSTGDYNSAKYFAEKYAIKVDKKIHKEVLKRWAKLNIAPYPAFINSELVPIYSKTNKIVNVKINYPKDFAKQMLNYSKKYSTLEFL